MDVKRCYKCDKVKDIREFGLDKSRCDGHKYRCLSCDKIYDSHYRDSNRNWINDKALKNYHKDRDTILKQRNENYRRRKGNGINPNLLIEKIKDAHRNSLARCEDKFTDITLDWLINMFTVVVHCPDCGVKMSNDGKALNGKTIDHIIPLNIGGKHDIINTRLICRSCNIKRPRGGKDVRTGKIFYFLKEIKTI